eukprot:COSAG03_NODE_20454_length_319_cov_0.695455_1_plen_99_part_10
MTVFVSLRGCLDASDQSTGIAQTERQRDRQTERQRGREVLVARVNATVLTVSLFLLAVGGRRNRTRMGKYHLITGPRPPTVPRRSDCSAGGGKVGLPAQ